MTLGRPKIPNVQRTKSGRISRSRESLLERGEMAHTHWLVYFGLANGRTKIGYSGSLGDRGRVLKCDVGVPVEFAAVVYVPSRLLARRLEATLHRRFADKRVKGEWFDLTRQDVQGALQDCRKIGLGVKGMDGPGGEHSRALSSMAYASDAAAA